MVLALSGIACIGLLISTRTDSGPGAAVATIVIAIASQILGQIPSLDAIHPYLPTYGWLGFTGLFRFPVDWDQMRGGLLVSAVYSAVCLGVALWGVPPPRRHRVSRTRRSRTRRRAGAGRRPAPLVCVAGGRS